MLNENVKKLLKAGIWDLATCAGGKLNSLIICVLVALGTLRYSELRKQMGNITDAVLASTLKNLIANGIVERRSYDEIPPRVEYSLTECGKSVVPILQSICHWAGAFYKEETPGQPMIQCRKCDCRFASTAINGKSAGHRIFLAACFSSAAKGDIMGTGKVFFAKWRDVLCRWKKQRSIWKAKAAWTM